MAADEEFILPRNNLEVMGVSGFRETLLGQRNEACCSDCRFLTEQISQTASGECQRGYGSRDLFSRFAMICADFELLPGIDDVVERRSGHDRRCMKESPSLERRSNDRRRINSYCSRLSMPSAAQFAYQADPSMR